MGHRDARRTLDDIEDCYIRLSVRQSLGVDRPMNLGMQRIS